MTPNVPLIAWQPDADPTRPGVIAEVENMVPTLRGYASAGDYVASPLLSSFTIPAQTYGAALVPFGTNTPVIVAGTSTAIYSVFASVLNISNATPYTPVTQRVNAWRFGSFDEALLVAQWENGLQYTTSPASGTALQTIAGAPNANTICKQSGFVMLGQVNGAGWGTYYDGWWCSALGDYTDWTPDVATQCARGRLTQTPGAIVRLVAFQNYVLAFKSGSIFRGTYVGTPTIWRWDVISTSVGLVGHGAICEVNGVLYWLGPDGFYRFAGAAVERIGSAPWKWLRSRFPALGAAFAQAHYDPARRLVCWHYASRFADLPVLTEAVAYHPETDRWGRFKSSAAEAINARTDYAFTEASENSFEIDGAAILIDEQGLFVVSGATSQSSSYTTGDIGDDDQVSVLGRVRGRYTVAEGAINPATITAQHYHRQLLDDDLTFGQAAPRNDGKFDLSQAARWHRVKFTHNGRVEVLGFSVDAKRAGTR